MKLEWNKQEREFKVGDYSFKKEVTSPYLGGIELKIGDILVIQDKDLVKVSGISYGSPSKVKGSIFVTLPSDTTSSVELSMVTDVRFLDAIKDYYAFKFSSFNKENV